MKKHKVEISFIKLAVAFLFFLCLTSKTEAQIVEQSQVSDLIDRWKNYNLEHAEVRGWRIQFLATVDRRQMEAEKRTFERRYPEYPTHMVNNQPYFHLKTGAFLTSQKAQAFLKKLQKDYPGAIMVEDDIKTEEMLLYDQ